MRNHIKDKSLRIYTQNQVKSFPSEEQFMNSLIKQFNFNITDIIPKFINQNEFRDRMLFIRKGLFALLYQDVLESIKYLNNFYKTENLELEDFLMINRLVTLDLISKISNSFLNIIVGKDYVGLFDIEELSDWQNLLLISQLWNKLIFENEDKKIT